MAEFIGSPAMNMIEAKRQGGGLLVHGIDLALNDLQRGALAGASVDGMVYGLRPEDVSLSDAGLPGMLAMIEPTGPETYLMVDTAIGKITVRVPGNVHQHVGEPVHLKWVAERAHLFEVSAAGRRLA